MSKKLNVNALTTNCQCDGPRLIRAVEHYHRDLAVGIEKCGRLQQVVRRGAEDAARAGLDEASEVADRVVAALIV